MFHLDRISPFFTREEFACKCGCGYDTVDVLLLEALERIRQHFDEPVEVLVGCVCKDRNEALEGLRDSQHLVGKAADIVVRNVAPEDVADYAVAFLGCTVARDWKFTHIDVRNGPSATWRI